jgi:hypothetical protein
VPQGLLDDKLILLAAGSLIPWLVLVWFLELGIHKAIMACWNIFSIGASTILSYYWPYYAWCPIIAAFILNTLMPQPRWCLTNLCLAFLACSLWLELIPLDYILGVLVALQIEGFVAIIQYRVKVLE